MDSALSPHVAEGLGLLVDSLGRPAFVGHLRRLAATLLPFDNLVVLGFSPDRQPQNLYSLLASPAVEAHYRQHYFPGAYCLDPYYQATLQERPAGLYRLREVAPDKFFQSEYFKAYYRHLGLIDEVGFIVPVRPRFWVHLSLSRLQGRPPFGATAFRRFASFSPLLMALIARHWHQPAEPEAEGAGRLQVDPGLVGRITAAAKLLPACQPLTRREAEITAHVLCGHSSTSIGLRLGISPDTVKVHRRRIYRKLTISSQGELFARLMPVISRPDSLSPGTD